MNLFEVAREIANRLIRIFLRDPNGRRPVYGGLEKFQTDPHWRDHILFHEYFHGDNGAWIGASHQTGWSGLVATLIELFSSLDAVKLLEHVECDVRLELLDGVADDAQVAVDAQLPPSAWTWSAWTGPP